MLAHERQTLIIEHLKEHRVIKIADIVEKFGISSLTARRDLDALRDRDILRRVYGGAILTANPAELDNALMPEEETQNKKADEGKHAMGKLAASMVREGDTIFLGTGTTIREVARHLCRFSNLTVITCSLAAINELSATTNRIYILGGFLDTNEHNISGTDYQEVLKRFCADIAFISCDGVTFKHGVTAYNPEGAENGYVMVQNCERAVLVCDSRKFGNNAMRITCGLEELHTIITDEACPNEYRKGITDLGINLMIAKSAEE